MCSFLSFFPSLFKNLTSTFDFNIVHEILLNYIEETVVKNPTTAVGVRRAGDMGIHTGDSPGPGPPPPVLRALLSEGSTAGGPGTPPGVLGLTNTQAQ